MPRKPYIAIFRPLSIRFEQPPSPTPSPTEYIAAMRLELGPPTPASTETTGTGSNTTTTLPAAITTNASSTNPSPGQNTVPINSTIIVQAPPGRIFDAAALQASGGVKIPRPAGIVAKPGAGGYTLSDILGRHGWTPIEYQRVLRALHDIAHEHLDTLKPLSKQEPRRKARYMDAALQKFPGLEYFEKEWPAEDFAYVYLKNSTAQEVKRLAVLASQAATTATATAASGSNC